MINLYSQGIMAAHWMPYIGYQSVSQSSWWFFVGCWGFPAVSFHATAQVLLPTSLPCATTIHCDRQCWHGW